MIIILITIKTMIKKCLSFSSPFVQVSLRQIQHKTADTFFNIAHRSSGLTGGTKSNNGAMMFKKACLALTASLSLVNTAAWADATPGNEGGLAPFIGGGLTFGGDKLAKIYYTNGDESSVTAGGLVDVRVGVDYRLANSPFALQGSVGYHVADASARNGNLRFSRVPVEVLGHWYLTDAWKIGVGARKATSPELHSSGAATIGDYKFDSNTGFILEGEYMFNPKFGLKVRYVNEEYKAKNLANAEKIDGSHAGVIAVYYFK